MEKKNYSHPDDCNIEEHGSRVFRSGKARISTLAILLALHFEIFCLGSLMFSSEILLGKLGEVMAYSYGKGDVCSRVEFV